MIRCIRLWNDEGGASHVQRGRIALGEAGESGGSLLSDRASARRISFEETPTGGALAWHTAPRRQFVVTLTGTLDFITRDGEQFTLDPATVLLAEDTVGTGHAWELLGDEPWRRVYVELDDEASAPFIAD